jgi:uncharacterized RDD family membrane protein YckC
VVGDQYFVIKTLVWIFTNEKRQRIFSRAIDTIVVKIKKEVRTADNKNIRYIKD